MRLQTAAVGTSVRRSLPEHRAIVLTCVRVEPVDAAAADSETASDSGADSSDGEGEGAGPAEEGAGPDDEAAEIRQLNEEENVVATQGTVDQLDVFTGMPRPDDVIMVCWQSGHGS
jgi:hypothetical protein